MALTKDQIFDALLGREGGYVDHPHDKGGPTNWGITEKVARAHGYTGDMRNLTRAQALEIYESDYWSGPRFDQVAEYSAPVAAELLDTGVNMGPSVPGKWLQRWLTAFNDGGRLYPDISADGVIGPRTLSALRAYLDARGAEGVAGAAAGTELQSGRALSGAGRTAGAERVVSVWLGAGAGRSVLTISDVYPRASAMPGLCRICAMPGANNYTEPYRNRPRRNVVIGGDLSVGDVSGQRGLFL